MTALADLPDAGPGIEAAQHAAATTPAATIAELRREARAAAEMHEALYAGEATWRDWDPSLTCPDRQEVAIQEAAQEAREARKHLAAMEEMS